MAEGTSQGLTLAIDAPLADHLDPDMPEIGRVVENLRYPIAGLTPADLMPAN
jgi:hypothetical protein